MILNSKEINNLSKSHLSILKSLSHYSVSCPPCYVSHRVPVLLLLGVRQGHGPWASHVADCSSVSHRCQLIRVHTSNPNCTIGACTPRLPLIRVHRLSPFSTVTLTITSHSPLPPPLSSLSTTLMPLLSLTSRPPRHAKGRETAREEGSMAG